MGLKPGTWNLEPGTRAERLRSARSFESEGEEGVAGGHGDQLFAFMKIGNGSGVYPSPGVDTPKFLPRGTVQSKQLTFQGPAEDQVAGSG